MVLRLALVGFVLSILALCLPDAARLVAGEAVESLPVTALGSGAFPALSHAESRPLTTSAHVASPPDESFALDDYDWDDDDSLDMLLLILKTHALHPTAVYIGFNGLTQACLWPTYYLVRPQLLTRL
jgi:hypothetical protein